jgi:hypothetical protein
MFTVTFAIHEKDGLDRTEALQYWRETHGLLAAKIPGVQHYVQQHAVGAPEGTPPFLETSDSPKAGRDRLRCSTARGPPRTRTDTQHRKPKL